jgi:DNA replication and repair protein RecF
VRVDRLWLTDFRNYESADLALAPGLTVVVGDNGEGKTNLLEAVGYLASLSSFRGAPDDALVRQGAERAFVRAEAERDGRALLIEAEIVVDGRNRVQVNRQTLRRSRDLLGALRASAFSPDDLVLVKGGPAERRRYLDDALVALHPRNDQLRADVDRILRQRNALLKSAGGRLDADAAFTLDVWDARFAEAGEALASARRELVERLRPLLRDAYDQLARMPAEIGVSYASAWQDEGLAAALVASRRDDVRRALSLVGPHRDDLSLTLGGRPSRTHASQGEQRSLALALRLAAHSLVTDLTGSAPVLLLDDVFSELDPGRSAALLRLLPAGQALLTTAGHVPDEARVERLLRIEGGKVMEATAS